MNDSGMIKRFMIASLVCEVVYAIAAVVIIFIRPQVWVDFILSYLNGYGIVPPKNTDVSYIVTVFGFIALFFVLWCLMMHMSKSDKDPLPIGVFTIIYLPAFLLLHWRTRTDMLERLAHEAEEVAQYAFYSLHYAMLNSIINISLISVVFLLMAYAAARQRYIDSK